MKAIAEADMVVLVSPDGLAVQLLSPFRARLLAGQLLTAASAAEAIHDTAPEAIAMQLPDESPTTTANEAPSTRQDEMSD